LQPNLAIVSVGANNKYGHPADEVLDNLRHTGSVILRTDRLGDITLSVDGEQIVVNRTQRRE